MHELSTSLGTPISDYRFFYGLRPFSSYSLYIRMSMLTELFGFSNLIKIVDQFFSYTACPAFSLAKKKVFQTEN